MSDKCEWKDGKFDPCEGLDNLLNLGDLQIRDNILVGPRGMAGNVWVISYCPSCGADIRKPEPIIDNHCRYRGGLIAGNRQCFRGNKCMGIDYRCNIYEPEEPLIVKSGGTTVVYWEGVDYLWMGPDNIEPSFTPEYVNIASSWVSFTGPNPDITELTDEIAKLRPMIVDLDGNFKPEILYGVLYGVTPDKIGILNFCNRNIKNLRLATPHELQDFQNE